MNTPSPESLATLVAQYLPDDYYRLDEAEQKAAIRIALDILFTPVSQ